jgi:methionine-R-sulfoxide reductase
MEFTLFNARLARHGCGLTPEERDVLLHLGTETPFCGVFLDNHEEGIYTCRFCGLPLFRSSAKFDSGTGWPSFFKPYDTSHIRRILDRSYGMARIEEVCARCGSHLGHVFPDGPPGGASDTASISAPAARAASDLATCRLRFHALAR